MSPQPQWWFKKKESDFSPEAYWNYQVEFAFWHLQPKKSIQFPPPSVCVCVVGHTGWGRGGWFTVFLSWVYDLAEIKVWKLKIEARLVIPTLGKWRVGASRVQGQSQLRSKFGANLRYLRFFLKRAKTTTTTTTEGGGERLGKKERRNCHELKQRGLGSVDGPFVSKQKADGR